MKDCMDGEEPYKRNTLPVVLHSLTWRQETGSCSSPVQGFGASESFVPQFSYQPNGEGKALGDCQGLITMGVVQRVV